MSPNSFTISRIHYLHSQFHQLNMLVGCPSELTWPIVGANTSFFTLGFAFLPIYSYNYTKPIECASVTLKRVHCRTVHQWPLGHTCWVWFTLSDFAPIAIIGVTLNTTWRVSKLYDSASMQKLKTTTEKWQIEGISISVHYKTVMRYTESETRFTFYLVVGHEAH